jgi:hypothetical protein
MFSRHSSRLSGPPGSVKVPRATTDHFSATHEIISRHAILAAASKARRALSGGKDRMT